MIELAIGGLVVRVVAESDGAAVVNAALARRWADFVTTAPAADVVLRVVAPRGFSLDYHLDRPEAALRITTTDTAGQGGRVELDGAARGWFDPQRREGALAGAIHFGEIDALVRLALSLCLPPRGTLCGSRLPLLLERGDLGLNEIVVRVVPADHARIDAHGQVQFVRMCHQRSCSNSPKLSVFVDCCLEEVPQRICPFP